MRPNLFGADIAGEIYRAMGGDLLPATLIRTTAGTRGTGALTAGQVVGQTTTSYPCIGFIEDYSESRLGFDHNGRNGTLIQAGDRKVILLGKSLPDVIDPQPGDQVTIEAVTYQVVGPVERDSAGATFTMRVRR